MRISLTNLHCTVEQANDDEMEFLRGYLASSDAKAHFKGRSTSRVNLFEIVSQTFPAGFLPKVYDKFQERNAGLDLRTDLFADQKQPWEIDVQDIRPPGPPVDYLADVSWLYDYQGAALNAAIRSERGILWLPTAAGKGEIAAALAKMVQGTWLFISHRYNLVLELMERLRKRTGEVGAMLGEGSWSPARVSGCTFQTLYSQMGQPHCDHLLANVQGILVDESHVVPAESYYDVLMRTGNARWRIGLSATPWHRGDRKSMLVMGVLGPTLFRVTAEELREKGRIVPTTVHFWTVRQTSEVRSWDRVYAELLVYSHYRNHVVLHAMEQAPNPGLVFVNVLDHGLELEHIAGSTGIRTEFVSGLDKWVARRASLDRMLSGGLDKVIATNVFQEGLDVPPLRSVVNAAGGKSVIAALQKLGRAVRPDAASGKMEAEFHDIADVGQKWLEEHTRARMEAYRAEGWKVVVHPESV